MGDVGADFRLLSRGVPWGLHHKRIGCTAVCFVAFAAVGAVYGICQFGSGWLVLLLLLCLALVAFMAELYFYVAALL